MSDSCRVHSRRHFLTSIGLAGSAMALLPACEYVTWRGKEFEPFDFDLAQPAFAALNNIGGMAKVESGVKVVLVRVSKSEVVALLAVCPHNQLDLGPLDGTQQWGKWIESKSVLQCMAHGSQFAADGSVARGPATAALARFAVVFDAATGKGRVTGKLAAATGVAADAGATDATGPSQDGTVTDASQDATDASQDATDASQDATDASQDATATGTDSAGSTGGALLEFDVGATGQAALANVGGMASATLVGVGYSAQCKGSVPDTPVVLVRVSTTQVACLSRICTHQCCEISPEDSGKWHPTAWKAGGVDVPANTLECTCHQSAFGLDGKVLAGPASEPLKVFATTFDPATGKGKVVKS